MADHAIHHSEHDDSGKPKVLGRYEVIERILGSNQGSQGSVYRARDAQSLRQVAIKVLTHEYESFATSILASLIGEQDMEELRREAQVLARLRHRNIVAVIETGEDPLHGPYVVMEWVAGGSLRQRLDQEQSPRLAIDEALRIVQDILAGLSAAHEAGIIHRDIKPENILLDENGRAKLADFGIAGEFGTNLAGRGTPGYMAPEQEDPSQTDKVGPPCDIYSVGVVLFEMLIGRLPRAADDLQSLRPQLPAAITAAITRAINLEPRERFGTTLEMAAALAPPTA